MDKQALLASIPATAEERMTLARLYDKWESCQRRGIPTFSRFLTEAEQNLAASLFHRLGADWILYGGYEGAERRIAVFLPDYLEKEQVDGALCELTVLRIKADRFSSAPLTHRDYLGALMAMGIERETVGDILVGDRQADLIVTDAAAEAICGELIEVGRARVECRPIAPEEMEIPEAVFETASDTVASLRLDCLVASAFRLSREEAGRAIRSGRVQRNGREATKPDGECAEGDKLALRGAGKAVLTKIDGLSKKGRIRILWSRPK